VGNEFNGAIIRSGNGLPCGGRIPTSQIFANIPDPVSSSLPLSIFHTMATHNSINTSVYEAIDPSNFTNKFKGKVVLVTGAGRGIGQGIAIAFARAGATLALLDLKKENLASTVKQCEELGSHVLPIACNVADTADVDAAIEEYIQISGS